MKKVIVVVLIGIVLLTGVIVTGTYGLSKENIDIYEQAVAVENGESNFGFEGFAFTDYPVAFYDGDKDYVVLWENDTYTIDKRKPVMNSIVATAYPVGEHYEVLTPTVEKMSSLLNFVSTGEAEYGSREHVATVWHEAFHCYQMTNFLDNIELFCPVEFNEGLIAEYADSNEQAVALFEQQAQLLEEAVKADDIAKIRECVVEYKKLDEERRVVLSKDVTLLEDYYIRVEGTACYIEACVYEIQFPEKFESNYIDNISEYGGGSGKYYKSGMAQCMIMDKLDSEWKNGFDFSQPVIDLIYNELEI